MVEKKIESRWLEGLKFHSADSKMVEKNGRKTLQSIATERPAVGSDVLSWKDYGDKVVIVLNDGMKHTVKFPGFTGSRVKEAKE